METASEAITKAHDAITVARQKWARDNIGRCLDEANLLLGKIQVQFRRIWDERRPLPGGPTQSLKIAAGYFDNGPGGCQAALDRLGSLLTSLRGMPTRRFWIDASRGIDDLEGKARGLRKTLDQERVRNAAVTLDLSEVEGLLTAARTAVQTFDPGANAIISQAQAAINVAAAALRQQTNGIRKQS